MTGPECSLLAFVSNGKAHCMAPAQDHKRAFDGDKGPNTGGMGVYSPVPIVADDEMAAMVDIMERAAAATARAPRSSSTTCVSAIPRRRSCCRAWNPTWWTS